VKRRTIAIKTGTDLGRAVAELRGKHGITQAELAELAGLTTAYVSKIESGRTSSLLEHELRILRRLGATITVEMPDGRP
jgi:transcriptional regulator with XRE-family HTH domain